MRVGISSDIAILSYVLNTTGKYNPEDVCDYIVNLIASENAFIAFDEQIVRTKFQKDYKHIFNREGNCFVLKPTITKNIVNLIKLMNCSAEQYDSYWWGKLKLIGKYHEN